MKLYSLWVLAIVLSGCSLLGYHPNSKTIVVTKAPVKVVMSGELEYEDYTHVRNMIAVLSTSEFIDYNFTEASITVLGGEATIYKTENITTQKE